MNGTGGFYTSFSTTVKRNYRYINLRYKDFFQYKFMEFIVTRLQIGCWDLNPDMGKILFLFFKPTRLALGPTQPPTQCVLGFLSGIKQLGHDVDHINPLNAELNPICHLLVLRGGETIIVVSG
jgi:hypothetical protein